MRPDTPIWLKVLIWLIVLAAAGSMLFRAYADPSRLHVPLWTIWLVAIITVLAPIAITIPQRDRSRVLYWCAIFFSAMSILLCWEAFGPGERVYVGSSSVSFGLLRASSQITEAEGRTFFGIVAIGFVIVSARMWKLWRLSRKGPAIPGKEASPDGWHRKQHRHRRR
jgi:hypothetical protein